MKLRQIYLFWRKEDGVAALEFALIAPILIVLFLGLADIGFAFYETSRLNQITRTTAEAAMSLREQTRLQRVLDQEITLIGDSIGGNPYVGSIAVSCTCPSEASPPNCSGICADGSASGTQITITANLTHEPIFLQIDALRALQSQLVVEVR